MRDFWWSEDNQHWHKRALTLDCMKSTLFWRIIRQICWSKNILLMAFSKLWNSQVRLVANHEPAKRTRMPVRQIRNCGKKDPKMLDALGWDKNAWISWQNFPCLFRPSSSTTATARSSCVVEVLKTLYNNSKGIVAFFFGCERRDPSAKSLAAWSSFRCQF